MTTLIRKMRCQLLYFLFLTVFAKGSLASNGITEDFNDVPTLSPERENDSNVKNTLPPSAIDGKQNSVADSDDSNILITSESILEVSTLPDDPLLIETSSRINTETPLEIVTDPPTTVSGDEKPNLKFSELGSLDAAVDFTTHPTRKSVGEEVAEIITEIVTEPTTDLGEAPSLEIDNNETALNKSHKEKEAFNDKIRESDLSPDKISKRILISSQPESTGETINAQDGVNVDSWRPLGAWSPPDESSPPITPTVLFPSAQPPLSEIGASYSLHRGTRESYSVLKEPVTAYYFDLASVLPNQPRGPLFDPSVLKTSIAGNPSNINKPEVALEGELKSTYHGLREESDDKSGLHTLKHSGFDIRPTPTFSKSVNTEEMSTSVPNINHQTSFSPVTEDITSQNFESTTIASIYHRTANDFKNSTPAYTLGNSTDFHFTQSNSNSEKASTNTSVADIVPSIMSSNQPMETQTSTGDLLYKSKQSLTTASLFEIPIHPSDLPSPISISRPIKPSSGINDRNSLMSRIPLWKRISQRKSSSETSVPKTPVVNIVGNTVSPLTPSSTLSLSSFPFENDIPIGILSPGILKYPARTSNDNDIREDPGTLREKIPSLSDGPTNPFPLFTASATTPSLDSSIESSTSHPNKIQHHSTPLSINENSANKDVTPFETSHTLLNTSPSSVHSSLSTSHKFGDSDIIKSDDSLFWGDLYTKTNVDPILSTATPYTTSVTFHSESEFIPMVTGIPGHNHGFPGGTDVNTKVAYRNDSSSTALEHSINDLPLNKSHFDLASNVADKSVNKTAPVNAIEKPAHSHPEMDIIISTTLENKVDVKTNENNEDIENLEGNKVIIPPLFANGSLLESFDNFTEKSTENVLGPKIESDESPSEKNLTEDATIGVFDHNTTISSANTSSTLPAGVTDTHEITKESEINTNDTETTGEETNNVTNPPSEYKPPSYLTFAPSSSPKPAITNPSTTPKISLDNLEVDTTESMKNHTSSDVLPTTPEKNKEHAEETISVDVIPAALPGDEPHLHLVKTHENGTNSTQRTPFIKAEILYDTLQFCQHQENIVKLLKEWINHHLTNSSNTTIYEIELFLPPDCKDVYLPTKNASSPDLENITYAYFYVKQNGEISPQSTRRFPKDPTNLEISQELAYLKDKIRSLELKESLPDPIRDEAGSAPLVVIVIVTSLIILLVLAGILACFMVKRRRSAETLGRRCTPAVNDAYSLDSVSVFYHSLRRKSKKRASDKSLKSYLNQGFDDPNLPSRPLNFAKLTLFITDNEAIYDEFSNIPSVNPKYDEMPRGVEDKNRYANVIPVPETRILLGNSKATPSSEYINANSIHGPKGELRYYIATQAPLDNTVADFWQMVWEQESKIIVMLTDFVEKGIDKCADYLPPSETLDCHRVYGEFQITLKSRDMRESYIMSLLQIKNLENNLVREIAHMWFTGWPQSGVPNEEKLFISFIFDVRTTRKQLRAKGPIVVHCSPGTGRTGTYIACDLCIRQFDDHKIVDVPKTVFRIRRERAGAVQTKEQYSFIYRVANLYAAKLTTGNLDSF